MSRVYATKNEYGSDESKVWTLSSDPLKEGWETDSGCDGYGLSKDQAEYYAKCINEYNTLLSKLEIAEKALALSLQYTHNENAYSAITEALQQLRS